MDFFFVVRLFLFKLNCPPFGCRESGGKEKKVKENSGSSVFASGRAERVYCFSLSQITLFGCLEKGGNKGDTYLVLEFHIFSAFRELKMAL